MVWVEGEVVSDGRIPASGAVRPPQAPLSEGATIRRLFAVTCTRLHRAQAWDASKCGEFVAPIVQDEGDPGQAGTWVPYLLPTFGGGGSRGSGSSDGHVPYCKAWINGGVCLKGDSCGYRHKLR